MKFIDLHCDTVWKLVEEGEQANLYRNSFSVDIEKLRAGQVQAQFFALFVNKEKTPDPLARANAMAERFFREIEKNEQHIALAKNYGQLMENQAGGKISAFLTIEEGAVLNGSLANLENF